MTGPPHCWPPHWSTREGATARLVQEWARGRALQPDDRRRSPGLACAEGGGDISPNAMVTGRFWLRAQLSEGHIPNLSSACVPRARRLLSRFCLCCFYP